MGRVISLVVAAAYLLVAYFSRGPELAFRLLIYLAVVLSCIWFGDEMGRLTGYGFARNINISVQTPGVLVRFLGWLMLILPAIIGLLSHLNLC